MPQDLKRAHFIPYFDGLRGFGALIVYLTHSALSVMVPWGPGPPLGILPPFGLIPPLEFLCNGLFAVDMFFALSGYVMSAVARRSRESFAAITVRRYIRLAVPAAVSCVLSAVVAMAGLYFNRDLASVNGSDWLGRWFGFQPHLSSALYEALISIFRGEQSQYNSSLWTMYTELWGSLLVFGCVYLLRAPVLCFAAFSASVYYIGIKYSSGYLSFAAGAATFFAHQLLSSHVLWPGSRAGKFIVSTLATLAVTYGFYLGSYCGLPGQTDILYGWLVPGPSSIQWASAVGGSLVVATITWSPVFRWLFSRPLMLWLGKVSFAFYLVHLPIICGVGSWLGIIFYPAHLLPFVITTGCALAAAALFEKTIDKPTIRFGRWISGSIDWFISPDRRQFHLAQMLKDRHGLPQMTMAQFPETPRSLTIIVPAYDEEARLGTTVTGILAAAEQVLDAFEVIIVDDGSRDGTAAIADELAANHPNISVIHHPTNRGVGAAYWSALQVARHQFLTLVPGDNAFQSECLPAFFSMVGRADIVISYRDNPEARTPIRRLLSIACTATLRLATGVPLRDGHSLYIWRVEKARRIPVQFDYRYHLTTLCALLAESSTYAQMPVRLTPKPDASSRVLRPGVVFGQGWMMLRRIVTRALSARRARPRAIAVALAGDTTESGKAGQFFSISQESPSPP